MLMVASLSTERQFQGPARAGIEILHIKAGVDLTGKRFDQAHAKALAAPAAARLKKLRGNARTMVAHGQQQPRPAPHASGFPLRVPEEYLDRLLGSAGTGVLERVGQKLHRQEPQRNGGVGRDLSSRPPAGAPAPPAVKSAERAQVRAELHPGDIVGLIELLMDLRDGANTGDGIFEGLSASWIVKLAALKVQQGGDQLERVLDPVVDLLQQHVLLGEQRLLFVEHAAHALLAAPQS